MFSCRSPKRKVLLVAFYMLMILATSLIPMDREIDGLNFIINIKPGTQNFLHIPVYALLAILWHRLFYQYQTDRFKSLYLALIIAIGFGIINEWIQFFIPGRYLSLADMVFNTIGVICGILIYRIIKKREFKFIRQD